MSRHHALLERVGVAWSISDLGAKNGTLVNGQRVIGTRVLKHADEILLGESLLVFRDRAAVQGDTTKAKSPPPRLTPAEYEVLVELVRPWATGDAFTLPASAKEISAARFTTEAATKNLLGRLYDKFEIVEGDNKRARLANAAWDSGAVGRATSRPTTKPRGSAMEVLASRYELLEEIKNDAGRTLFRAHDMQLDRKVALKIVELDDTHARDELLGEVKILLRLEAHAALPYMREGFALDDEHFVIVMDWVDGQNLADVLDQQGSPGLTSKAVVQYVLQAAAALDHLHSHEPPIVHGDVKPSNLVLTPSGKVVLVDFGIAHQAGASVDAGTRGYVAPEVWRGEPSSPAADIFGLAATAYALLSGAPPDHRRPPDLDPDPVVARVMDGALRQALATDPARRPRTAVEFADRFAASSRALPEGTVTFMSIVRQAADEFSDSEDEDIGALRDRVDDALGAAIEEHGGRSLEGGIDSDRLDAVFTSPSSAASAALALHQRLAGIRVPAELRVSLQVALHTGEAAGARTAGIRVRS